MNWRSATLDDVIELRRGFDLPSSERVPGAFPVVSAGKLNGTHHEAMVEGPGFAVGRATNLGKPQWSETDFWPLNTTLYATDFKGNNPKWLYHLFETLDLAGFDSGSVQPMLNRNYIKHVPVLVPPRGVQDAISEVIGALDDKIAANRQVIEVGDQLIRGLVRRTPTTRLPLVEAFTFKFGEAFKGEHFSEPGTGRPLIRIRDLKSFRCKVWTKEIRRNEIIAEPGTLLVGMDAEFRATRWAGPAALVNQRVMKVSSAKYGNAVAMVALEGPLSLIERSKVATTVIHLNKSDLATETVAVPLDDWVAVVRSTVDPLYDRSVAASLEIDSLARTRDELLPILMNGRITVKDAEQAAEAVL
ncbi:restriction endonuclease subunit S [Dietzia aurantiaca]|uniref:restriction endonuclease subunit S n=1 Tax=Dietzia aurantiaca TaxID=983873 RepID=UPI001E40415E|nr:restriction endonuclease subunit S [Dietzia aurantiaca]